MARGTGLVGLKDRVETLGGQSTSTARSGAGTTMDVQRLPVRDPADAGLPPEAAQPARYRPIRAPAFVGQDPEPARSPKLPSDDIIQNRISFRRIAVLPWANWR